MPATFAPFITALAVFSLLYAALTGWRFALRLRSERGNRRKGIALNVVRRALPPVLAGLLILGAATLLNRPATGGIALLIVGGGVAYAFHRGLAEMRQDTNMLIVLRLGASLGLTFAYLWLSGGA